MRLSASRHLQPSDRNFLSVFFFLLGVKKKKPPWLNERGRGKACADVAPLVDTEAETGAAAICSALVLFSLSFTITAAAAAAGAAPAHQVSPGGLQKQVSGQSADQSCCIRT